MPILSDCQFVDNTNIHEDGNGAVSIYYGYSWQYYPVDLTVESCVFKSNEAGKSGALSWTSVNMNITDSIFEDNVSYDSAALYWLYF